MDNVITTPSERVGRHINQKAYYRSIDGTVKHNAFMPNRNGETSVYLTSGLSDEEIWEIGDEFVGKVQNKPILGHAEIMVDSILNQHLTLVSKPNPHPRHADIIDWPESQSERKSLAQKLAAEATLIMRPTA